MVSVSHMGGAHMAPGPISGLKTKRHFLVKNSSFGKGPWRIFHLKNRPLPKMFRVFLYYLAPLGKW
jgi:hypothetical protein